MKLSNINGLLLLLSLFGGCVGDSDLHTTFFIRDKQYPDLPQYSEWGYNTFGAYINNDVFVSGDYSWDPATIMAGDTMILSFYGEIRSKLKDTTEMTLSFIFPRNSPRDDQYLLTLEDSVIDLTTSSHMVLIQSGPAKNTVTVSTGELHFTRVQNLLVDNNPVETILSGTFELQGIMNENPVSITLGRFDVGVSYYYRK